MGDGLGNSSHASPFRVPASLTTHLVPLLRLPSTPSLSCLLGCCAACTRAAGLCVPAMPMLLPSELPAVLMTAGRLGWRATWVVDMKSLPCSSSLL